jgi:hypothetical protein
MITPGTRLEWHDLNSWMAAAKTLGGRRYRAPTKRAYASHWNALELELAIGWIRAGDGATVARLAAMLQASSGGPWHRPPRGDRAGKWERLNMETKNRIWRLARQADQASIGIGHNARRAACA